MKCNNYISSRFLALALALTVTLLAQVNISHGLDCYVCVFAENNVAGVVFNNSATCEKNPTDAELFTVTKASLANSAAVLKVLKGMGVSQENPSPLILSTNVFHSNNAVATLNGNSETDATDLLYCSLSTFNIQGLGRVVLRSAATATGDLGSTHCDNKMIPGSSFEFLSPTNVSSCVCRVSRCNGKTITAGAEKAGQSIAFLVFSIGLAILALTTFGQ